MRPRRDLDWLDDQRKRARDEFRSDDGAEPTGDGFGAPSLAEFVLGGALVALVLAAVIAGLVGLGVISVDDDRRR